MIVTVLTTQYFIPIILLLGLSTVTSFLISVFRVKFLPTFAIEILIGLLLSGVFNSYIDSNNMRSIVDGIYALGLVMIMFLSGYDVEFDVFDEFNINEDNDCKTCRHRKCRHCKHINIFKAVVLITVLIYAASIAVSLLFFNQFTGNTIFAVILLTLVFASTFAGLVVPIMHNEGILHTVIGKVLAAIANLSEALSILFLTILMIATDVNREYWIILLLIAVLLVVYRILKRYRVGRIFSKITEGIDHLATRFVIVLILVLVLLSDLSGGEYILGAFVAGIFVRQAQFSEEIIRSLSRIIYGVFAPMFFLLVGANIDITVFFAEPHLFLLVLYAFIGLLVAELPVLYLLKWYKLNTVIPSIVLLSSTIVVPIAANHINEHLQLYSHQFGEALILASLLLCIIGTILFEVNFPFGNYRKSHLEKSSEE